MPQEKTTKEKLIEEFENKYSSFELCNQISKPELDKLKNFLSQAINQTREETIMEVEEMLSKIVLKDLSGKWSEEVIDFSTSIVDATVLKIKQSLKLLINK